MRVITGLAKGRALKAPKGIKTRPTTDRVKETLFNIINPYVLDARVLDLYSGSGAVGIEALSRGAQSSVFVEMDLQALKAIKQNLDITNFTEHSQVIKGDVIKSIVQLGKLSKKFDIIFMDPPYQKGLEEKTLNSILENELLSEQGLIIVEHSSKDILPKQLEPLEQFRLERYGDTSVAFYRHT